jgi:Archaeal DNA polymerase II, large subunit
VETDEYFSHVREKTEEAYEVAEQARDQSKDPEQRIDIPVAEDLPEKASSLVVAAKFPELEDTGVAERIRELENEYGKNDERVSFQIGSEIADGRFHDFDDLERACNAGVRVGVSYMTGGITTAPLEGIADVNIRENEDGSDYLSVYYSGPIRSAGGTASAMSVLLADHVRNTVGLDRFKPSDTIVKRYATEVDDYYNRVTAKQYKPEREETEFISEHVPVEVTGGPTRDIEVSNHKDLDRVDTNQIRGGMCLVYLDGLPLKASKIKKRIKSWGEEFGLEHWKWIEDYIDLQEEIHSSGGDEESDGEGDEPDYTASDKFLDSLTAGRPVFAHPGRKGGFRLRYGSSRTNGLAAAAFHPATMEITEGFIATGTQLKVEYPMKGTVSVPCDSIHGPVVRLEDGSVERIDTRDRAKQVVDDVDEILFLGDMLVPYGEFVENGKDLLPSPYVEEWWQKELEEALKETGKKLGKDFSDTTPTPEEAFKISEHLDIPLHPHWTYHWDETTPERFRQLVEGIRSDDLKSAKPALEDLLVPHSAEDGRIRLPGNHRTVLEHLLPRENELEGLQTGSDIKELVEESSGLELGDQAPHYLGARMGRPEKAEKRTIQGDPQILFPCGKEEGGRMRNLVESYESGTVDESIIHNVDPETGDTVHYSWNPETGNPAEPIYICQSCGNQHPEEAESCESCGNDRIERYTYTDIPVEQMMDRALDNLDTQLPDLLKSVRGMSSKHKHVEPLEKGLLREKYDLYVNKDGTVRYDATDIPMTHFTPEEVSVSPEKLREIGYTHDIDGEPLENSNQVLEMKPQDIVIPEGNENPASRFMLGVAQFIDDLLEQFYGLEPFYNADSKEDLVGELVIGLAPHTSGGTVGRIIGFTDAKGIYSHPYWHAAKRRNCFDPDTKLWYRKNGEWRFESAENMVEENIGEDPETDDFGNRFQTPHEDLYVPSVSKSGETEIKPVEKLSKHQPTETMLEIRTTTGESITVTEDHRMQFIEDNKVKKKRASKVQEGDSIPVPSSLELSGEYRTIDLLEHVAETDTIPNSRVMVSLKESTIKSILKQRTGSEQYLSATEDMVSVGRKAISNYVYRESVPVSLLQEVLGREQMLDRIPCDAELSIESDNTSVSRTVELNARLSTFLGYYAAEGFTGERDTSKGPIYQTSISAHEKQIRDFAKEVFREELGASPYEENEYKITASGRLLNFLFDEVLNAGRRSYTKRVPQQVFSSPDDIIGHFLSGYFSGDGSASSSSPDVKASTVSEELKTDLNALLQRLGISATNTVKDGIKLKQQFPDFYDEDCEREARPIHNIRITSTDAKKYREKAGFHLERKQEALDQSIRQTETNGGRPDNVGDMRHAEVESISEKEHGDHTYCLTVEDNHSVIADNIAVGQCDGDEDAILMLMDGLLNFSRQFLPDVTGARTMDAPLILSTVLNPDEIDDEAWAMETVSEYPLQFYRETQEYKAPWELDCDVEIGEDIVHSDEPFDHGYTHETSSVEDAPMESAYVSLGEMSEKTSEQLGLGKRTKAVDEDAAAELLLKKHFLPDIRGNLSSFSEQEMRCVDCNEKFRRVPMTSQKIAATGKTTAQCPECGGDVLLTISEGTIRKYMQPSKDIIEEYEVSPYTRQQILNIDKELKALFGKNERQSGLGNFA